jgi:hypothetical protein
MMRRQPNGQPEYRGLDDLLRDAVSDEEWAKLLGKGKPLDLGSYFRSGEEDRLANKILSDHGVLPPHLQDRKEIERLRAQAEINFERNLDGLTGIRDAAKVAIDPLIAPFDSIETFRIVTNIEAWPDDFPSPQMGTWASRADLRHNANLVYELQSRYKIQVKRTLDQVRTNAKTHNQIVESLHRGLIQDGRIIVFNPIPQPVNVEDRAEDARARIKSIPSFPPDLGPRLLRARPRRTWKIWRRPGTSSTRLSSND